VVGVTILRNAALRYASHGYPVFPLRPRSKTPALPAAHPEGDPQRRVCHGECGQLGHGLYDATTDPEQVFAWWRWWPMGNIGIPTGPASGLLVVDLDGAEGLASWAKLEHEHGQVDTLTVLTGRGRHLWFTWPEGCELGNSRGLLGPHVDSRGIGGLIVAAPSVHPTGQLYRWYPETRPGPNGAQKPPVWLLEALQPAAPAPRRARRQGGACVVGGVPAGLPRHLERQAAEAPAGDRSRQTWRLVAAAIEWGLDDGQVLGLALSHEPTTDKYGDGDRARDQVETIIDKIRPDHRHVGRPCDRADCPNKPRWMVTA
jgi:Bifunctional DNA primase/polymerase, N-terminal